MKELPADKLIMKIRTMLEKESYSLGQEEKEYCEDALGILAAVTEGLEMRLRELEAEAEDDGRNG